MTAPTSTASPTSGEGTSGQSAGASRDEIDLEALAEKVMRLLKDEARLERERLGRRPPARGF